MSFRIFSCVACGRPFYDYDDRDPSSWLTQFRILYSSPGGISVSGVGLHNEIFTGEFIVHLEYTSRWDDPKYLFIEGVPIGVMTQRPINDRHGFIFHEACWYLLEKIYHPESVPCSRLYEVCKSMPLSKRGAANISWGHDYGGLLLSDNDSVHPGQRMIFNLSADRELRFSASMDPMCGPEIRRLLEPVRSLPFLDIEQFKRSVDVFSKLPREIRDMIACLLPMPDVLNLRLASWSFISLFENQQFWASRFGPAFERSWLFELWESSGYKNWRWLYLHTAASKLPPALQNRKRIWELLEHVKDITNLQWKEVFHASVPHADVPGWKYRKIAADVKPETPLESDHDFDKGCRLLRQQNVAVPQLVSQVAVSTVQVGDTEYVSGMRVVSSEGAVTEFGYWSGKKEYSVNITSLGGFNVAIGSRGIQAIQVLDEELTSRWLGFADECPKTQYLAVSRPIKSIEAGFDACKMISLAVEYEDLSVIDRSIKETKSLRDIGLWYPEVPGRNLYLNDYPSSAANHSLTEHQPLSWILFGGPGGTYLRYVSGISVIFRRDTPRCIEFTYDLVDIELEDRMLGRRGLRGFDKAIHFPIDGAGGEIIEAVEVMLAHTDENDVHNSCKHPVPKAFRVLTNRGRRLNLEPPSGALYDEVQAITTAPGTTITGFYVSEHPAMGLISLGVISEIVHDDEKRGISLEAYKHLRELD